MNNSYLPDPYETITTQHWPDANYVPAPEIEKIVHQLRMRLIEMFFKAHDKIDSVEKHDEEFNFKCNECFLDTLYYRRPHDGYNVPLCLTGVCLTKRVVEQGNHYIEDSIVMADEEEEEVKLPLEKKEEEEEEIEGEEEVED